MITRPSVLGLAPLVALLAWWEWTGTPSSPYFPAPSSWGPALLDLHREGLLGAALLSSARTFVFGLLIAVVLGTVVGLAVGRSAGLDRALNPSFEFGRALPPAVLVPLATLFLGFGEGMRVSVVAFAAWWAILLNIRSARRELDGTLLDAARSMGLGPLRRHVRVILPALFPAMLLGIRVATPIALVITLLAEYLTGTTGIGGLLGDAQRTFRPARVYGLIVAGTALSLVVDGAVATMQHAVTRRRTST